MGPRNLALSWLRKEFAGAKPESVDAVLYFADDDNAYDLRLFDTFIRPTKGVSCWPVAFPSNQWVESAKIEKGRVTAWDTVWNPKREFAIDMAGFAIHLSLILRYPDAVFGGSGCSAGNFEPCFLKKLGGLKKSDLEPIGYLPGAPKEILAWHTKTKQNEIPLKGPKKGFIV